MPIGLYTRWDYNSQSCRFTTRQNKTRSFESKAMSYFQRTRPDRKIESLYTTGREKKIDPFNVDGFWSISNLVFEVMGSFHHFCACQEVRSPLTEKNTKRGGKKRELDAMRANYIQEKKFAVSEMWQCEWWRLYRTATSVKQHVRETFPNR